MNFLARTKSRFVYLHMVGLIGKLEVFESVISPVSVFMVNNLGPFKISFKFPRKFESMLKNKASAIRHRVRSTFQDCKISVGRYNFSSLPVSRFASKWVINFFKAIPGTKMVFVDFKKVRFSMERFFTNKAFNIECSSFHNPDCNIGRAT